MSNNKWNREGDSKLAHPKPQNAYFLETRDDPFSPTDPMISNSSSPRLSMDSSQAIPNPFADANGGAYGRAHIDEYSPTGPIDYFSRPTLSVSDPPRSPTYHSPGQSVTHASLPGVPSIGNMQELNRGSFRGSMHSSNNSIREAFTPPPQRAVTASTYSTGVKVHRTRLRSTMLKEDTVYKPWMEKKDSYGLIVHVLTYAVMFLGVIGSVFLCYFGWTSVPVIDNKNLCMVMDERWEGGDEALFGSNGRWFREVQMDGFGNGQFEMTTSSSDNSYVKDGNLYIVPTLTSNNIKVDQIYDGYTFNITDCSYNATKNANTPFDQKAYLKACSAVSNSTSGTVINPVQSARLSTRQSASIRYGKVEVRAKLPRGDWLWPAIWMLPVDNAYGPWPVSGEIDIMEARGNSPRYPLHGYNVARGSLHWGPMTVLNRVWMTWGLWRLRHTTFADDFHTYTLEWTSDFLRIYVDTRLHHMLDLRFNIPFFKRGNFPNVVQNGSDFISLQDPWINGGKSAPFDQKFYLILNLAVGGTNGWFPNGLGDKPWLDESQNAMRDFARSQDQWYSTWPENAEDRALVVNSVKMWELC